MLIWYSHKLKDFVVEHKKGRNSNKILLSLLNVMFWITYRTILTLKYFDNTYPWANVKLSSIFIVNKHGKKGKKASPSYIYVHSYTMYDSKRKPSFNIILLLPEETVL